jgi:putative FmdB family regulatory protein
MPIYEYHCAGCGHTLDALQKLGAGPLRKCPDCGKPKLRRLVSAPAFRLKGSGWYETDFKNDGEKKRNLVESASSDAADGGGGDSPAKADAAKDSAPADPKPKDGAPKDGAEPVAKKKDATPKTPARAPKKPPAKGSRSARP